MKLLGLETSSSIGSVALLVDTAVVVREIPTPREQTDLVLRFTDELLSGAGIELRSLDGIAFGRGPGSFTGLRVAAAVAQGLGLASGVALLPVSSLLCLAQGAWRTAGVERSLVCVDARMGEVYWAEFVLGGSRIVASGAEHLGPPEEVRAPAQSPWTAVGGGFAAYREPLAAVLAAAAAVLPDLGPSAQDLFPQAAADLAAGRATPPEHALPVYLRDETAWRRRSRS
jgi:tRNA threonylcarbamoyladenosine biosynthesis protein TsaB